MLGFHLTSEQQMLQDSARRLAERHFQAILDANEPDRPLPKAQFLEVLAHATEYGLHGPRIPVAAGGAGMQMLDYGIIMEQIQPTLCASLVSQDGCIARIYAECDEAQKTRFIDPLLSGRKIGCTASTEPDTGSDPRGVKTRIMRTQSGLKIIGRKMWVTNISVCDFVLVTGIDPTGELGGGKVIKVVVDREQSPFEAREIETIGLRQGYLGEAVFDACIVPEENLILSSQGGTRVLMNSWAVNRPLLGLNCVHLAERAFRLALDYAKTRRQFGKRIAAHQLVQKNLSDIETAITASRLLCYRALSMIDRGEAADGAAAMAKRFAQNACSEAIWQCMNVLGAMGLSRESRLEEMYRDIRMIPVPDGTNEILALIHGREITGIGAFRDGGE
jgi:alkylation response protein AidB-like acyl-CoA dehydrogenase